MPPEAIGIPGTLWLYRDRVRIIAGRHVSEHAGCPSVAATASIPSTSPPAWRRSRGSGVGSYLKRQELLDLGPVAETFLTEIVHRHRFTWKAEVEQLHGALLAHGSAALQRSLAVYAAHHVLELMPSRGR
jgi:hypothetical protein